MFCPFCGTPDTKVTDSRLVEEENQIRRRRECIACNERFTTYETAELLMPQIIKRDQRRVSFEVQKLRIGMLKALEKRPIEAEALEACILRNIQKLRTHTEREISSKLLGEWVMEELKKLDPVGYVRFASVYKSFEGVYAFHDEIKRLEET